MCCNRRLSKSPITAITAESDGTVVNKLYNGGIISLYFQKKYWLKTIIWSGCYVRLVSLLEEVGVVCRGHAAAERASRIGFPRFSFLFSVLPFPARCHILSGPVRLSEPSVPVAVSTTGPFSGQCHPQRQLTSKLDAPSTRGPTSGASQYLMTRWTGVRAGCSITRSATPAQPC